MPYWFTCSQRFYIIYEEFEDIKEVIRIRKSKDRQCNGQESPLITAIILSPQNISGLCNRLTMSVLDEGHVMHTKLDIYVFIRKIMLLLTFKKNILQSGCTRMDATIDKSYYGTV